jgi:serine/threonine-protein kinase
MNVSKYKLGARLGGGGMGEVFRATLAGAAGFSREVAIKRVLPELSEDPELEAMLRAEARIAALLQHPNIASVLDCDRDEDGRLFLVMELVEGKSLAELLAEQGPLPMAVAVFITAELLRALAYAHALEDRGHPMFIVHRDVSPENVLCAFNGAVKLTDFGIAKAASNTRLTRTGVIKGKAAYLSPEQVTPRDLDGRSDLFALGAVLHEMLTGKRLFDADNDAAMIDRVLNAPIVSPRAADPSISEPLALVCLRLLERNREARFYTANEALEALLVCPEASPRAPLELAALLRAPVIEAQPGKAPPADPTLKLAPRIAAPPWKTSLVYFAFGAIAAILALLGYQCYRVPPSG